MVLFFRMAGLGVALAGLFLTQACSKKARPVTMVVSNPIDLQRINEGVAVPISKLPDWVAKEPVSLKDQTGKEMACQRDDLNGDGRPDEFYFQISLAPQETASLQIQSGSRRPVPPGPFKVFFDHDLVSIEGPAGIVVSKGPEAIQVFTPSRKSAVLSAGYGLPGLSSQESQNRLLSQGPLRVLVEQKALWRSATEAYIIHHRMGMALHDPLLRSVVEKVRWPQGTAGPALTFDLEQGPYRLKAFSTRWLLNGEGSRAKGWNAAVLFKAGTLLQPRPVTAGRESWRQVFNNENGFLSLAWMAAGGSETAAPQEWDRQTERAQQRWLNPIEVFVAE